MLKPARWLASATLLAALMAVTSAQAAATYTVNTTADNPATGSECSGAPGDCSLRQALDKAASGDTVVVPASATPYLVTAGQILVPDGVTIQGAGASATTISGGGSSQLLELDGVGPVVIKSLTLANAFASISGTGATITAFNSPDLTLDGVVIRDSHTDGGYGGAMEVTGDVTIRNSRFTHDTAAGGGLGGAIDLDGATATISGSVFENNSHANANGGAIYVESGGMLTVTSSTFTGNSPGTGSSGGAVAFGPSTSGTFQNTTFSGNSAPSSGGALYFDGTSLSLVNDTFSGNSSALGASLDDVSGTTSAQNTIFAAPQGGGSSCSAALTTTGHDVDDRAANSCGLSTGSGDLIGVNPGLGALADNSSQVPTPGGPPQTMSLPASSPAVGSADAAGCSAVGNVDERGFPRPGIPGSGCDIGAFETLQPAIGTSTAASASNTHPGFHQAVTLTAGVASARALPPAVPTPSGTVTFKDGTAVLGTAAVSASTASLTTSTLPAGAHQITATYSGDGIYTGSASGPVALTVAPPAAFRPPRPAISRLRESHKVWQLGSKHARISRKIPVGTRFTFKLNTQSNLRLTFRKLNGRHKGKRAGTLTFKKVKAGTRKLSFQGRLKGHRKLAPGRYSMTLTASNSTGHSSRTIRFRIVKG